MHSERLTAGETYRRHRAAGGSVWEPWRVHGPWPPHRPEPARVAPAGKPERQRVQPGRRKRTPGLLVLGRTSAVLASVAALLVTATGWSVTHRIVTGVHSSSALSKSGPKSTGGAQNILLMGLDTRKDQDGNDLPADTLAALHAGDGQEGGYNTNTLILVHIPAGAKHIVAFSIPRDDLVNVSGVDVPQAKIKEAYGRKKALVEQQMSDQGVTDQHTLEQAGREAGRAETVATVEQLTGVPIDKLAEVSLVGFYDMAKALGGVQVCLKHDVHDSYSGANFTAGVHTLNASQSLAFVRQRHGLDNGDLDRTHRQQAFLLSVLNKLQTSGTLTDPAKLSAVISVLQQDVVVSAGWNLLDWASTMSSVQGQQISFTTLPVERYDTLDGEDVNIIDPDAIRRQVQTAFGMPVTAPTSTSSDGSSSSSSSSSDPSSSDTTTDAASTTDAVAPQTGSALTSVNGVPCVD